MRSRIPAIAFAILAALGAAPGHAQAPAPQRTPAVQPPAIPESEVLLDPDDVVLVLLDHQSGLLQTVADVPVRDLRANVVVLGAAARLAGVPVITTASEPDGPNGPLIPEVSEAAPDAVYVARKGEISAWDNPDFRKAVRATGRKTLVLAGVWTSVCVTFPALQAQAEGYQVYAVIDASGDPSEMASRATLARLTQAGVVPTSTNAMVSELQRTWARPDAPAWAAVYAIAVPAYRAAIEGHRRAQEAATKEKRM